MGKQRFFNVKGCIAQGENGPKLKTTKQDENKSETHDLGGGTIVPLGTVSRATLLPILPSYFQRARFGVVLCFEGKLCQREFS